MKKIALILLALAMMVSMFAACSSKTPDVVASEEAAALTLDTLDWKFAVEGADKTEYTLADAKAHDLSKVITSVIVSGTGDVVAFPTTFIVEGVNLQEFLADVGAAGATKITYYGHDVYGAEMTYTLTEEECAADDIVIGWIKNKAELLPDSITYVGIYGPSSSATFTGCNSITKIVIG